MIRHSHATTWWTLALTAALGAQALPPRPPANQPAPPAAVRWDRALDAWEAGRYPDALRDLIALASSPAASEYHERTALLTGELFQTVELATDGRNPRISAHGHYVAYDTGAGPDTVTRIVSVPAGPRVVADLRTSSVAFDPAGTRVAWLRAVSDGQASSSAIVVRDLPSGQEREWLATGRIGSLA